MVHFDSMGPTLYALGHCTPGSCTNRITLCPMIILKSKDPMNR